MPASTDHELVRKKCSRAFCKAIGAFPELLARCEYEDAAKIVADLVKTYLNTPAAEEDAATGLANMIREAAASIPEEFRE